MLGSKKLDTITTEHVQRLKHALQHRSGKTVNNVLSVLNVMLKKAVEWDVIDQLPSSIRLLPNENGVHRCGTPSVPISRCAGLRRARFKNSRDTKISPRHSGICISAPRRLRARSDCWMDPNRRKSGETMGRRDLPKILTP